MLEKICLSALVITVAGCGTAQFSGRTAPSKPSTLSSNATAVTPSPSDNNTIPTQNASSAAGPSKGSSTPTSPVTLPIPATCPTQDANILVLDFKSGWWSGDGGDFVNRVLSGFSLSCSTVKLEYHHLIKSGYSGGHHGSSSNSGVENIQLFSPGTGALTEGSGVFANAFFDSTWASYTQIWVLSGSSADPEDLQVDDPFFVQVMQHIKSSKAPLFIGVGYGSISHGNAIAGAVSAGASFNTAQPEGSILDPMGGVQLKKTISAAQLSTSSPLFDGIKTLADEVVVAGVTAHGDAISDEGGVTIIATDNLQQATLAVGTNATRKIVLDADMPRYYAAWSNESVDTISFQENIVVYLAK